MHILEGRALGGATVEVMVNQDRNSPFFDRENGRLFPPDLRQLIELIANDARFTSGREGTDVAREVAGHLTEERFQAVNYAAHKLFESTVGKKLRRRAAAMVRAALKDPNFEVSPWLASVTEDSLERQYFTDRINREDSRLLGEIDRVLYSSSEYKELVEDTRKSVSADARKIYDELPTGTRDRLVLASRTVEREDLLVNYMGDVRPRRRVWYAYYVQRHARELHSDITADRYSAAVKHLFASGWTKKAIADVLRISASRMNSLLARPTVAAIADTDPLCALIPELRGKGGELRSQTAREAPKVPVSSRPVRERTIIAATTNDADDLERLARDKSVTVASELIQRHRKHGDLPGAVLAEVLRRHSGHWMLEEALQAHEVRQLPDAAALELAKTYPGILLTSGRGAMDSIRKSQDPTLQSVVALMDADLGQLEEILSRRITDLGWKSLYDLLTGYLLPETLAANDSFAQYLVSVSERLDGTEEAIALRLVACQNRAAAEFHRKLNSEIGHPRMTPEQVVSAALGPYGRSGATRPNGVMRGAQMLWSMADLTLEHALARATIAHSGSESTTLETSTTIYVASPNEIRAFAKGDETTYTYVHLHLTAAREHHLPSGGVLALPTILPALPYERDTVPHPSDPEGRKVSAITWPVPFSPAIYSLDVDMRSSSRFFAIADGRTALIRGL